MTPAQEQEVRALMGTYPYRIVYMASQSTTGETVISAVTSMRIPNKLAREGW